MKSFPKTEYFFIAIIANILVISGCFWISKQAKSESKPVIKQIMPPIMQGRGTPPPLTIWVHGTKPSKFLLKTIHAIVKAPYKVFTKQPLPYVHSRSGLQPASVLFPTYLTGIICHAISTADSICFPFETFYVFGWSGKLGVAARQQAAQEFYQELIKLRNQYQHQHGISPYIRIITHSHGGNVALYLADVKKTEDNLHINELILLACPVQQHTKHLIADEIFDRVYALYSTNDMLQVLDPQGLHGGLPVRASLFSERTFPPHKKLRQVHVKINNHHLWHISFILKPFIEQLSHIIAEINQWYEQETCTEHEIRELNIHTKKQTFTRSIKYPKHAALPA